MAKDFVPRRDGELLSFARSMSANISASPATYDLSEAQAASLAEAFAAFDAALATVHEPVTRSPVNIGIKNSRRAEMVALIRRLAAVVQNSPNIGDAQRQALGLTIRSRATAINRPADPPMLDVKSVVGRRVTLRAHLPAGERRGRPSGSVGLFVYAYAGETPPAGPSDFTLACTPTRTTFEVVFPPGTPQASQVWVSAAWVNPRLQTGPRCEPVTTFLQRTAAVSA